MLQLQWASLPEMLVSIPVFLLSTYDLDRVHPPLLEAVDRSMHRVNLTGRWSFTIGIRVNKKMLKMCVTLDISIKKYTPPPP